MTRGDDMQNFNVGTKCNSENGVLGAEVSNRFQNAFTIPLILQSAEYDVIRSSFIHVLQIVDHVSQL